MLLIMEEDRKVTRSAGAMSRNTQQSEAANRPSEPQMNIVEESTEVNNINEVTNYTVPTAAMTPLMYVNEDEDKEGLQEQFLTEDEDEIDEIPDIPENRVVTPVDEQAIEGPLNPRYTQQTVRNDLDVQPSRGPKKEDNLGDTI